MVGVGRGVEDWDGQCKEEELRVREKGRREKEWAVKFLKVILRW